ncbi:hypothetical protein [Nitratifractor salsuginis]|uniref:Uncharacterized protein n=1 Tax=Nitratifractor salsuginis (strain DSM 16511 / JCM 12458 / E9I37-1) TaxID=749222 RepID=E6WYC5_NITSE|nr:hypothetical protein [Nitratifractor salsuginis]ADV46437.1 hypothetical protein Nitsa_1184 [Nitratifractor salsuginis DSM 16511]
MEAIKISRIKALEGDLIFQDKAVKEVDLGDNPSGLITKNGDVLTYDNMEVLVGMDQRVSLYDVEGIEFEEHTIHDLLEYWNTYAEEV